MKADNEYKIDKIAPFPFNGYYAYLQLNNNNRRIVVLWPIGGKKSNLKRTTISYAKYILSIKLGRWISRKEEVDHIDNDKTNDAIDNLQILTPKENNIKKEKILDKKVYIYKCLNCKKLFEVSCKRRTTRKNGNFIFCSKKCSASFYKGENKNLTNEQINTFKKENFVKEVIIKRTTHLDLNKSMGL